MHLRDFTIQIMTSVASADRRTLDQLDMNLERDLSQNEPRAKVSCWQEKKTDFGQVRSQKTSQHLPAFFDWQK